MAVFKDQSRQKMYETCRALAADTNSTFYVDGRPHRGASHRAAYWNGRAGKPSSMPRNSLGYACWKAGKDDLEEFGPVEGAEYKLRP